MARRLSVTSRGFCALLLVVLSGFCMGDTRPKISIMWGAYPEEFEGLSVEIDGKVAGTLTKFGENPQTAFLVDKGEHTVRVIHPKFECVPATVRTELRAQKIMLLLDFEDSAAPSGEMKTVLVLR